MRRILLFGAVGLAMLTLSAQTSEAGLFHCWGRHCGRHCTTICMQPYNAFSPVCYGSLTCVGCSPFHMGGGPMMPPAYPGFMGGFNPYDCMPPSCYSSGCCDSSCLPAPAGNGTPAPAPNGGEGQKFTPPPPTPLPSISYYGQPMPSPLQTAGYYGYAPYYGGYNPWMMPVGYPPNPWYGYPQQYGYPQPYGHGYPQPYGYPPQQGYPQQYGY